MMELTRSAGHGRYRSEGRPCPGSLRQPGRLRLTVAAAVQRAACQQGVHERDAEPAGEVVLAAIAVERPARNQI